MKNSGLVIKIAVGVSAVAAVFSVVTLIRAIIIGSSAVFPLVQMIGSAAIFAVCFLMLRSLKASENDGQDDTDKADDNETAEKNVSSADADGDADEVERTVDELYKKYKLSDFEE